MQLERVQRLGLLAMAHVRHSTPTAGLEAILDVMLLDLFAQCVAVQVVLRVQDKNQHSWEGIRHGRLRGHFFWGGWNSRMTIQISRQTKLWLAAPGGLGDTLACLAYLTLGLALQAIAGHDYLNYHHNVVGKISEQICCLFICFWVLVSL